MNFHSNDDKYDIIYKDKKLMYLKEITKKNKVEYVYIDMNTYKEIDTIVVGG